MQMKIGDFLLRRLQEAGVDKLFGVPGDFNLSFCQQVAENKEVEWVGTCNELNGSYAADGFARAGRLGVMVTTYGVGCLSALNGIAGAYCEFVPVLLISGTPPIHAMENGVPLHHSLLDGGYRNVHRAYAEFTVAQASLTPDNAATEIDRVILACWRARRPARIELPSDITHIEIEVPDTKLVLSDIPSSPAMLKAAIADVAAKISNAKSPVMLVDLPAIRYGAAGAIVEMAKKFNIPVAMVAASTNHLIAPNFPQFVGSYAANNPQAKSLVENSDCLLCFGVQFTDVSTGYFSVSTPSASACIHIDANRVRIGNPFGNVYNAVNIVDFMKGLADGPGLKAGSAKIEPFRSEPLPMPKMAPADKLTEAYFFAKLQQFLKSGDVLVAETGTSGQVFGAASLPEGVSYLNQPSWGSIGFATPALFGSLLALPKRRHVISSGDGSFQLTAQELGSMLRHKLKPVFFLINNRGYTIERSIMGANVIYNDVANWDYAKLPAALCADAGHSESIIVETAAELEEAMKKAESPKTLMFIEVRTQPLDMLPVTSNSGIATMKFDYGVVGPKNPFTIAK